MRKRYSRSYTVLSFLTMFSYRELPSGVRFFVFQFRGRVIASHSRTSARAVTKLFLVLFLTQKRFHIRATPVAVGLPLILGPVQER